MRLSTLILLFVIPAFAQATQPMTFQQTQSGQWQGKNVTSKEILAYVVEFESTHTRFDHDYYFKPQGIMPNAVEDFTLLLPPSRKPRPIAMTGGKVIYVQFVDGTEWGDHATGEEELLRNRQPLLRLISEMVGAYSRGGDKGFSQYIETVKRSPNDENSGFAQHIWIIQQQSGTDGALGHLKVRLASAAKHDKTLMENR